MQESENGKDYKWYEMSFFTRWNSAKTSRVLCIGASLQMSATLETMVKESPPPTFESQDPLAMLKPLFDEIIKLCDENTWAVTKKVRAVELVCYFSPVLHRTFKFITLTPVSPPEQEKKMRVRYTAQFSTAHRTHNRSRTGSHRDDGAASLSAGEQLQVP